MGGGGLDGTVKAGLRAGTEGTSCRLQAAAEETDYMALPQPVRYEELQREVMSELRNPWLF